MTQPPMKDVDLERLQLLAAKLLELQDVYIKSRELIIGEVFDGHILPPCVKCNRLMLPRSVWNRTPAELREVFSKHVTRAGAHGKCASCVTYQYRGRPLTEEKLMHLRRQVGLIK